MHFLAFPFLLLFTSTICAAPVHIDDHHLSESANGFIRGLKIETKPLAQARTHFHGDGAIQITEWSNPGSEEVVETTDRSIPDQPISIIVKRINLRTVVPAPGLRVPDGHSPQLLQVFIEIKNLEMAQLLRTYFWGVNALAENVYVYIEMKSPGVPSSRTALTEDQKRVARERSIWMLGFTHKLRLDPEHNQDKYFGFDARVATPFMLRYAENLLTPGIPF